MNKYDRLRDLKIFFENLEDEKFCFSRFLLAEFGTGEIIYASPVGWLPAVFPGYWKWEPWEGQMCVKRVGKNKPNDFIEMARFFEISILDCYYIFKGIEVRGGMFPPDETTRSEYIEFLRERISELVVRGWCIQ